MEEFLENLLYSATFPEMDKWRRFSAAPEPPLPVMRVFVRMELRLQHRYGLIELERLVEARRLEQLVSRVRRKINVMGAHRMWSLLTSTLN
jgi:hypothetical protein